MKEQVLKRAFFRPLWLWRIYYRVFYVPRSWWRVTLRGVKRAEAKNGFFYQYFYTAQSTISAEDAYQQAKNSASPDFVQTECPIGDFFPGPKLGIWHRFIDRYGLVRGDR